MASEAACACGAPTLVFAAVALADDGDRIAPPGRRLVCPRCDGAGGPSDEVAAPAVVVGDAASDAVAWAALAAVATTALTVIVLA